MDTVNRVQILLEAVCVSFRTNALEVWHKSIYSSTSYYEIVGQTGFFRRMTTEFRLAELRLKIVLYRPLGRGWEIHTASKCSWRISYRCWKWNWQNKFKILGTSVFFYHFAPMPLGKAWTQLGPYLARGGRVVIIDTGKQCTQCNYLPSFTLFDAVGCSLE